MWGHFLFQVGTALRQSAIINNKFVYLSPLKESTCYKHYGPFWELLI